VTDPRTIEQIVEQMRAARRGEVPAQSTPMCHFCGAAYTPHVVECPNFGEPPPVEKAKLPPVTPHEHVQVEREAIAAQFNDDTPIVASMPFVVERDEDYTQPLWPPDLGE
jgi:hypothetical protein